MITMRTLGILCLALGAMLPPCLAAQETAEPSLGLEEILQRLHQSAQDLTSYECRIEYILLQPRLFDSRTLRTGRVYYKRIPPKSCLRIDFETLKQDDDPMQPYAEHFIFDGEWLTRIDDQTKSIQRHQVAEPNQPVDAFKLAGGNMPIIGFSADQDLKKEFEVTLVPPEKGDQDLVKLSLKVRPESKFKDTYVSMDFWISFHYWLPVRVEALTHEEEIHELVFLDARINQDVDDHLFEFERPEGFKDPEIHPLKPEERPSGR